ncbi:tRNA 4-thiouridine(8) synthase ThiI [Pontiella sp.]|uniref:tRNA 4-thiouridine(8) synthase ThiI n=1 Tax=Pontiella sp. TaxID=2837462 RepID=UPI003564D4D6
MPKPYKALSLLSGGLDSQLAVCVLREQGIHVEGIVYNSPFFGTDKAEAAAKALGIPLHIVDFTEEILDRVQHPKYGIGGAMNPCIDCHATMIERAGELMEKWGFDFIATGEVLAQRPMSQNKQSLGVVARASKFEDLLVRPLSAGLLPPTKPIREGWLDVDELPRFSGRNRTPQMELAKHFGIEDYPAPAGGCLLTEQRFGEKLKDLLDHEGPDEDRTNVWLLPTGRHIRLADDVKIIVGSCKEENDLLDEKAHAEDYRLTCPDIPSPLVIVPPNASEKQLEMAAAICVRYAKNPEKQALPVEIAKEGQTRVVEVAPMAPDRVVEFMITP